jgi:DNA-binding beta-propeller fold protein YncE
VTRTIDIASVKADCNGIAVTADATALLVSDFCGGLHGVVEVGVADGVRRRVVAKRWLLGGPARAVGDKLGEFNAPCQVCIAADGYVFVADNGNCRVQVLTPQLEPHGTIGDGVLHGALGVCVGRDTVVVSDKHSHALSVFGRHSGALLRTVGGFGAADGRLHWPCGLCMLHCDALVAVADHMNDRVCVFDVSSGEFVRRIGVGVLSRPVGVALSPFDEIVVADSGNQCVRVFRCDSGLLLHTVGAGLGCFVGVATHGCTIFAQCHEDRCVVFS